MTSTTFTDTIDTLGLICAAIGAVTRENLFLVLGIACFLLSFAVRLHNEGRIERLLKTIRKVKP